MSAKNVTLRDPWVIAAFEGWGDAADASVDAVDHLVRIWDASLLAELDPDEYYDFQFNRPLLDCDIDLGLDGDTNATGRDTPDSLIWCTTSIYAAQLPGADRDVLLLRGIEPNLRWRRFCTEVLDIVRAAGAQRLILLGSLLADTPHSHPAPVSGEASGLTLPAGLDRTAYSGPVGIGTVLKHMARQSGLTTAALWAAVPHYIGDPPCPKATMALLESLEDITGLAIDPAELIEMSVAWQRGADGLVAQDDELAEYVRTLENEREQIELPEASGDAIAREFERFLRRRDGQ